MREPPWHTQEHKTPSGAGPAAVKSRGNKVRAHRQVQRAAAVDVIGDVCIEAEQGVPCRSGRSLVVAAQRRRRQRSRQARQRQRRPGGRSSVAGKKQAWRKAAKQSRSIGSHGRVSRSQEGQPWNRPEAPGRAEARTVANSSREGGCLSQNGYGVVVVVVVVGFVVVVVVGCCCCFVVVVVVLLLLLL